MKSIARLHHEVFWLNPAKWVGTISGVAGAVLVALNIDVSGVRIFAVFVVVIALVYGRIYPAR